MGCIAAAVTLGVLAVPQPAHGAAFVWIAGRNFAYSAATCATPGAAFWAWFLAVGPGATTAAATACTGPFGSAASFAIARAGIGGAGAAFVGGIADPWAGIEVGTDISNFSDSSTYNGDSTNDNTEFTSSYTLSSTGVQFDPNATDSELNAGDTINAYLFTGDQSTSSALCTDFGGTNCTGGQNTQTGDVTDLSNLQTDLGLTPLGSLTDPGGLGGSTLTFSQTVNPDQVILVGEGFADTPEPVSMALFGGGLCGLALLRRRKRA